MSQVTQGGNRTLSAFFDTEGEASRAVDRLVQAGLSRNDVRLVPGNEGGSTASVQERSEHHSGFFGALSDLFFPDEDRYAYAEGLSRGGYLVVVNNLSSSLHDTALDILDDEGSIDLDEREASWRSEGWSGYSADQTSSLGGAGTAGTTLGTSGMAIGDTGIADDTISATGNIGSTGSYGETSGFAASDRTLTQGDDEVIPVVDERLVVGKRDVNLGRIRVRSYVREEPVSADVNLRNERVTIERRPVDRALTGTDAAFADRTLEAEEHSEEAVVGKEARVTEEISLRKEATEHTETVRDTVRKTEVDIEDERTVGTDRLNKI